MAEDGNAGKMDRKDVANKATGRWLKEADDEDEDSVEEGKYKRDDDEKKGNPFAKKDEEEEAAAIAALAAERVSGTFPAGKQVEFVESLKLFLPVEAEVSKEEIVLEAVG